MNISNTIFRPITIFLIILIGIHFSAAPVILSYCKDLGLLLTIGYFLFLVLKLKKNPFKKTGYERYFLLLLAAGLVSVFFAYLPEQALADFANSLALVAGFYLLSLFVKNAEELDLFLIFLLAGLSLFVFFGWFQYLYIHNQNFATLFSNIKWLNFVATEARGMHRISSLFIKLSGSNVYSAYLSLAVPFYFTWLINYFKQNRLSFKIIHIILVFFLVFNITYTLSRGLLVALAGLIFWQLIRLKNIKKISVVVFFIACFLLIIPPIQKTVISFFDLDDVSNQDHFYSLISAVRQSAMHPLTGWGGGHVNLKFKKTDHKWQNVRNVYFSPSEKTVPFVSIKTLDEEYAKDQILWLRSPHNIYFYYFLEYGFLGLFFIVGLLIYLFRVLNAVVRKAPNKKYRVLSAGALNGLIAFSIYCFFQDSLKSPVMGLFFLLLLLLILRLKEFSGIDCNKGKLIILAYHRVLPKNNRGTLAVTAEMLERQLRYLKRRNYLFLTVESYYRQYLKLNKKPDRPLCIITFDDGYQDNYLYAYPVLAKLGLPATLFVTVAQIGEKTPYYWDYKNSTEFSQEDVSLTWPQLKKLKAAGWEIASHTLHHWEINKLPSDLLKKELTVSKEIIDQKLQQKTVSFCAPRGAYDAAFIAAIKEAGYLAAVVTPKVDNFPETNYTLKRIGLYGPDNFLKFKIKISFFFNCLRKLRKS